MADTRNTTLTIAGMNLLAKTQQGKELHFTRVMMGDGKIPAGMNIKDMTEMVNPILKLPIANIRLDGTGTSVMECILKNAELEQGFHARELGIFASDPDTGEEVLYAIRNTGDYSEFIPSAASGEVINFVYSIITVVGQSENVTVTIEEGIGGVSRPEFYDHVNEKNPHPGFLQVGGMVDNCVIVFVGEQNNPRRLERIKLDDLKTLILGDNASTFPIINGRISQLELELANIGIQTMVKEELNLSNLFIYEDFQPANLIDDTATHVTAITAGSNTIAVESLAGITQGSWYWITDGILKEAVQVASMQNNDDLNRIITKTPIANTYNIPATMLYRSTAGVKDGMAVGSADRRAATWKPSLVWKGEGANTTTVVLLDSSLSKAGSFRTSGDAKFTADGYMTLDASIEHAHGSILTLVRTGGGKGTWALTDEKGASF